jgi:3-oxoacyl-[acyl-carrier-protein] synthase III
MKPAIGILGAGRALPVRRVLSAAYDHRFGKPVGWAQASTGVASRACVGPGETASSLGADAARAALADAGLDIAQVDCVIGASGVMEQPIPGLSVLIHRRLGLQNRAVPAFDVNATCLSFLAALRVAALEIAAGAYRTVLIVSADVASAALDQDDPTTAPLFGDGAAAVLIGAGNGVLAGYRLRTFSEGADAAWLGAGGSRLPAANLDALLAEAKFRMDGPVAYRIAARAVSALVDDVLADAGWRKAEIDLVIPHQASGTAMALLRRRLGFSAAQVVDVLADHGNLVAAGLPTALAVARERGQAQPGAKVLLLGAGAGVSLAAAAVQL